MFWPSVAILAVLAAIAIHLWWRARFASAQETLQREILKEVQMLQQAQERAAHQVQTQQEALFNSMAEGLLLLDQDGRIQLANRAFNQLFGITANIRSRTIMEALRLHELSDLVEFLGTHRQVVDCELKLLPPNERWLQVNGAAIFNAEAKRQGTILVFHDLTRLKQLERTRQEFVANVSHELRTPLSLIKGYAETLLDGAKDNPEVAVKFLQTIDRNAERLKLLIEDLLTISELESGRLKLNLQPVSLRPLVEKLVSDFKSLAEAKQVTLVDEAPDLRVRADAGRLEQVLCNLIENAIKYGRNQGTVAIRARQVEGTQVEVSVQDNGPGIPPDSLERIFERFYRVDKARSREQGGTGLGLSIVKHIVQTHGGKAWVKSDLGHGATFYFTLPQEPQGVPR
ncbi:MAG TPA: ATP-binding protein [Verrucomicrobiae bacterium]|nr:ATP-binding protein [Verrucomicrobiae bacterium]